LYDKKYVLTLKDKFAVAVLLCSGNSGDLNQCLLKGIKMDPDFWHQKWESNVIGFHISEPNPLLVSHFKALSIKAGSRVFLPLCGKTLDISWLLTNGYRVAGAELSEIAVNQLFEELGIKPNKTDLVDLTRYSAENIDIFVGDIFHLSSKELGAVDAIYDRGAFVALPKQMRERYAAHLNYITNSAPQLLISFEYNQELLPGPPFAISNKELTQQYRQSYEVTLLASEEVVGGLKGKCEAVENVWLLKPVSQAHIFDAKSIALPQPGKWRLMLPILILFVFAGLLAYHYNWDATFTTSGALLAGLYTGLISWLLGMISLVPVIGPIIVKILTMSFIWLLNAIGYFVSYVAIKRGYSKDVLTYRGLTIAVIVGMVVGYVIGRL
jgi:thiopurine S-methyltransferase